MRGRLMVDYMVSPFQLDYVRSFSYVADMPRKLEIGEKLAQLRAFFRQEGRAPSRLCVQECRVRPRKPLDHPGLSFGVAAVDDWPSHRR